MKFNIVRSTDEPLPSTDARYGHTAIQCGRFIFVMGGARLALNLEDAVLDVATETWTTMPQRFERAFHSACLVDDTIVTIGGLPTVFDDDFFLETTCVGLFDVVERTWSAKEYDPEEYSFISHRQSAEYFESKREIVVFGGRVGNTTPLDGIHVLDVDSMKWREMRTKGGRPPAQTNHETCSRQDIMFVLCNIQEPMRLRSELYLMDYSGKVPHWSILRKEGRPPRGVYGGSLNIVGSTLVQFAGYRSGTSSNDVFKYDLRTGRWSQGFFEDSSRDDNAEDTFDIDGPTVPPYGRQVGLCMNDKIRYISGERVLVPDIIELELELELESNR